MVVFYGDYLLGIYNNSMVKDGIKLYEMDYFIYFNIYVCEYGVWILISNIKVVSLNDFMVMVVE